MSYPALAEWVKVGMPSIEGVTDLEACEWYLQELGLCLCGAPVAAMEWLLKVLEHWDQDYDDRQGNDFAGITREDHPGAWQFLAYVLDDPLDLMEHGSSAPGWVGPKGRLYIQVLRRYLELKP